MTRVEHPNNKVRLSVGNWLAIAGITITVLTALLSIHRTMIEMEVNQRTLIRQVERNTAAIDREIERDRNGAFDASK